MWEYSQSSGELRNNNILVARGYSGNGYGKNAPDYQAVHNVGPIPRGVYTIGPAYKEPYEHKAPPVMHLIPDPENEMFGRDGFLIHGDSIKEPGTASEGCIILAYPARCAVASASDKRLTVIR